jgi:RimJ/RimL family protein N-acetyltransferase
MEITKYNNSYFPFVQCNVLDKREFTFWTGWELSFPLDETEFNELNEKDNSNQFIAKIGKELIGFVEIGSIEENENEGYFTRFLIGNQQRNRGYGTQFLKIICKTIFEENNKSRIFISTYEQNPIALRLYENNGFKIIEKKIINMKRYFPTESWTKVIMQLEKTKSSL